MKKIKLNFPIFACQHCGKRHHLEFDPDKEIAKWASFKCPSCDVFRISEEDRGAIAFMREV